MNKLKTKYNVLAQSKIWKFITFYCPTCHIPNVSSYFNKIILLSI